jgi:hypothetical protein
MIVSDHQPNQQATMYIKILFSVHFCHKTALKVGGRTNQTKKKEAGGPKDDKTKKKNNR